MATPFQCPACRQMISADVPPGGQVQCPLCNQVVMVPAGDAAAAGAGGPVELGYASVGGPTTTSGLAIASLICGVVGLCSGAIVGIVGVILGIVALGKIGREPQRLRGRGMAITGICTGSVGIVFTTAMLISILLPSLSRARELSKRTVCAANLRGIGQAMYIYAQNEPNGAFPDDINKVISAGNATANQFTCPSAPPTMASFYYVPGFMTDTDPGRILMYEDPMNHGGEGGNILYQDGHVQFMGSPRFEQTIGTITLSDGTPYAPHEE